MLRRQLSRHANQKRLRGRRGHELDLLPLQSVPITTKAVSSNPIHGEVYSMQHFVTKDDSNLRHACGFLRDLRFPPPIKLIPR
jgi:hypothetical protein